MPTKAPKTYSLTSMADKIFTPRLQFGILSNPIPDCAQSDNASQYPRTYVRHVCTAMCVLHTHGDAFLFCCSMAHSPHTPDVCTSMY